MANMRAQERIIVALDLPDAKQAIDLANLVAEYVDWFKVRAGLMTSGEAVAVIHYLQELLGRRVFYDAKFHDTPEAMYEGCYEATKLGVSMISVHCLSGRRGMNAAKKGIADAMRDIHPSHPRPTLMGVTLLTSHDYQSLEELGLVQPIPAYEPTESRRRYQNSAIFKLVKRWAQLAHLCELDGVIASPNEASTIRSIYGPNFLIVTPGIRPRGARVKGQARYATPRRAIQAGADYLVIGDPIRNPTIGTPIEAVTNIIDEVAAALEARKGGTG
jgi:orotidine-5'-phosphate decarboxylase